MACTIPKDEIAEREMIGLICACLAVAIGLTCVAYFDYIKQVFASDYIEYDVKTVTAGDYTAEFKIQPDFFDNWDINHKLSFMAK
jgi:hypothetical protein